MKVWGETLGTSKWLLRKRPVISVMCMKPGIGRNASCTLGDFHFQHLGLCDVWLFAAKGVMVQMCVHAHYGQTQSWLCSSKLKEYLFSATDNTRPTNNPPCVWMVCVILQALVLTFSGISGRLKSMHNKLSNVSAKVDQNFLWWMANGDSRSQASGAYIFNPIGTSPHNISLMSAVKTTVIKVFTYIIFV